VRHPIEGCRNKESPLIRSVMDLGRRYLAHAEATAGGVLGLNKARPWLIREMPIGVGKPPRRINAGWRIGVHFEVVSEADQGEDDATS
jgi:hypothetical protein